ncbi:MAG: G5 domain-containing protein [Flaviflexus sp.]|nr:G5 domain-containing protein [Flaviflexus sp.]
MSQHSIFFGRTTAPARHARRVADRRHLSAYAALSVAAMFGGMAVAYDGQPTAAFAASEAPHQVVTTPQDVSYALVADGSTRYLSTNATTWRDALAEAGIDYSLEDEISVGLAERPRNGAHVTISRVSYTTVTDEKTLPFETVKVDDPNLEKGTEEVRQEGVEGLERTTYRVKSVNGEQVSKTQTLHVKIRDVVNKEIAVGTKAPEPEPAPAPAPAPAAAERQAPAQAEAPAPAPAPAAPMVSVGGVKGIAQQQLAARGMGGDQFRCLDQLWTRESGWNYTASNPYSGAYGIPQALPGSKMASAGADWRTNPATQIAWGLNYIAGRYGTPCGALSHSHSVGWY